MPWTTHGYWNGPGLPTEPGPALTNCGGPRVCVVCGAEVLASQTPEALAAEHQADAEQLREDLDAARAELEELKAERIKFAGGYLIEHERAERLEIEADELWTRASALEKQLNAAGLRQPEDHGAHFDIYVGPRDTPNSDGTTSTRWQVHIGEWPRGELIADEARPYKAAAWLKTFIDEAKTALEHLESLGVYREDRPAAETPDGASIARCPALPCPWHTTWDTEQEATDATRRHVVEDHEGDPSPTREYRELLLWQQMRGSVMP